LNQAAELTKGVSASDVIKNNLKPDQNDIRVKPQSQAEKIITVDDDDIKINDVTTSEGKVFKSEILEQEKKIAKIEKQLEIEKLAHKSMSERKEDYYKLNSKHEKIQKMKENIGQRLLQNANLVKKIDEEMKELKEKEDKLNVAKKEMEAV